VAVAICTHTHACASRTHAACAHAAAWPQLLERPADAIAALDTAAQLAGGASKDITQRLKALKRWVNTGAKPAAVAPPPPAAAQASASDLGSGFKFKPEASSKAKEWAAAAAAPAAAAWIDQPAADTFAMRLAAALPDASLPLAALASARAGRLDAPALALALADAAAAANTPAAWGLLASPLFALFAQSPLGKQRRREAAAALEAFRAKVRGACACHALALSDCPCLAHASPSASEMHSCVRAMPHPSRAADALYDAPLPCTPQHTPGLTMPLLPEASSLPAAASCAAESSALRRAALEAANAVVLGAARRSPSGLFDDADVAALLEAGLVDALMECVACAPGDAELAAAAKKGHDAALLQEAAAGVFYNLCAHARRLWAASPASDAVYEQLCRLLDREGNPLEADAAGCTDEEWEEGDAHAFFAPLAQLLGATGVPPGFFGHLSLQKIRTNALGAAQGEPPAADAPAAADGALPSVLTVLALLERVAARGPADALRALAKRQGAAALQTSVAARMRQYRAMGRAVGALELRPDKEAAARG
jgi:hypothetical protein